MTRSHLNLAAAILLLAASVVETGPFTNLYPQNMEIIADHSNSDVKLRRGAPHPPASHTEESWDT